MLDRTAANILARLSDLENNPDETISPYLAFNVGGKLYYFTPGGFLYRRDPGTEEVGGFFCGYLTEEVWRYRTSEQAEEIEAPIKAERRPGWRFWRYEEALPEIVSRRIPARLAHNPLEAHS